MLNPDLIIARAACLLSDQGLNPKLSDQAKAVIKAISEQVQNECVLLNQAVTKQINAVRETPSGRMKKPTLDEVKLHGAKIGLPENECEKLFDFYEANGWRAGKSPMRLWTAAMANWKRRLEQPQNGAVTVIMGREYERIIERMKTIKGQYGEAQTWCKDDLAEFAKLKQRRNELRKRLGIVV